MRFFQVLLTDISEGFSSMKRGIGVLFGLELILMLLLIALSFLSGLGLDNLTVDDFIASVFGGTMIYDPSTGMPFQLPIAWLLIMSMVFFLPLSYPLRDLSGYGLQVLVASKSRAFWWISKCFWLGIYSTFLWFIAVGLSLVIAFVASGGVSVGLSQDVAGLLALDTWDFVTPPRSVGLYSFVIAACFMTWALCVGQLAISLWVRPVLSFAINITLLFASAFFFNPLLPGQYLMAGRSSLVINSGVDSGVGLMFALLLLLAFFLIGGVRFARMDLVGKEYSA